MFKGQRVTKWQTHRPSWSSLAKIVDMKLKKEGNSDILLKQLFKNMTILVVREQTEMGFADEARRKRYGCRG